MKRGFLVFVSSLIIIVSLLGVVSANDLNTTDMLLSEESGEVEVEEILTLNNDEEEVLGDLPKNYSDLQALIDANPHGEITLDDDYQWADGENGCIFIYNGYNVTINGNGHTIDASGKGAFIFYVLGSDVVLNNITFKNTFSTTSAIYWSGNNGVLANSTFTNNGGSRTGGAVCMVGNNNTVVNTTFDYNFASALGGAVYVYGPDSKITDCEFKDNFLYTTSRSAGGSVYVASRATNTTVKGCNFTNQYGLDKSEVGWAGDDGHMDECSFENLSFTKNVVEWSGKNGNMSNSKFKNVTSVSLLVSAPNMTVFNTTFDKVGSNLGGAIYTAHKEPITRYNETSGHYEIVGYDLRGDSIKILNSTFKNSGYSVLMLEGDNGLISGCTFENNTSLEYGSSVYVNGENTTLKDSTFSDDYAIKSGGSIFWWGNNGIISNITVNGSRATNQGGAIYLASNNINVSNLNVYNSKALFAGALYIAGDKITVRDSTFDNNSAVNQGGSISGNGADVFFQNLSVLNSKAYKGGGFYWLGSNTTLKDSLIQYCEAEEHYGGIYWAGSEGVMNNTIVDSCVAVLEGGGICWNDAHGLIINSRITNNSAAFGGGVLWWAHNGTLENSTISYNSADNGGGVFWLEHDGLLKDCTVTYNSAVYEGGGVAHTSTELREINNIIHYNTPDGDDLIPIVYVVSATYAGIHFNMSNGAVAFCLDRCATAPSENVEYFHVHDGEIHDRLGNNIWGKLKTYYWLYYPFEKINPKEFDAEFDEGLKSLLIDSTNFPDEPVISDNYAVKRLNNGSYVIMEFKLMYPARGDYQPLMVFDWSVSDNPDFEVEKIVNEATVNVGDQTSFTLIVKNTGDCVLSGIVVTECEIDGLIFNSYTGQNWIRDGLKFKYNNTLNIGHSANFTIVYDTIRKGNFTNFVVVSADLPEGNKTANNTTHVREIKLSVDKITLTKTVKSGDKTAFEIIVRNDCEWDVGGVFVIESIYDKGISYNSFYSKKGSWTHILNSQGQHQFNLMEILKSGDYMSFVVVFDTYGAGNFSNTVTVGFNNTTVSNSTNITEVIKDTVSKNRTHKVNSNNKTGNVFNKTDTVISNVDAKATGNPIMALLLILAILGITRRKI